MNHLLVTNFYIADLNLATDVATEMIVNDSSNIIWDEFKHGLDKPHFEVNHFQNLGRLQVYPVKNKENLSQNLLAYMIKYEHPTYLYLGSLSELSTSMQEGLLRFIEEPPLNLHLLLTVRSKSEVLPTILSRCQVRFLPSAVASRYLDRDKTTTLLEALPESKVFAMELIKNPNLNLNFDFKRITREAVALWLWQLEYCLAQIYLKNQTNRRVQTVFLNVLEAQKMNEANVLNRLVIAQLSL